MAIASIPQNFFVQPGDGSVFLSWNLVSGATTYSIQRSTDGVNYSALSSTSGKSYSDSTVTDNTLYYYQVASVNASGTSPYTTPQTVIPTAIGINSLGSIRLECQQRCDKVNSNFITTPEWNSMITKSYKWLYNLMIQKFGNDYYVTTPYSFTTDGVSQQYPLPPDFYKLMGVEVALNPSDPNSWVTVRKFEFIQRNLWNFPNVYTFYGITNLRYRLVDNTLYLVPISTANQTVRIWYAPRPSVLVQDTDVIDGISGFEELVIEDVCIKAMIKEESDPAEFRMRKAELMQEINEAAENRDIGEPEKASDVRRVNFSWGDGNDGSGGIW